MIDRFDTLCLHGIAYDTPLGFYAFCLKEMPEHSLAPLNLMIGIKRSGKGNLVASLIRYIY